MGLEARRVPLDFKHPTTQVRDKNGRMHEQWVPCVDNTFGEAAAEYERNRAMWIAGTHPDQKRYDETPPTYEEWAGDPPRPENHLPDSFDRAAASGWCLYENVTEGTPVTPVFKTREELVRHLVSKGAGAWGRMSEQAAEEVIANGAASFSGDADGWHDGVKTVERYIAGK